MANHRFQALVMESEKVVAVGIFNCCRYVTDLLLVLDSRLSFSPMRIYSQCVRVNQQQNEPLEGMSKNTLARRAQMHIATFLYVIQHRNVGTNYKH